VGGLSVAIWVQVMMCTSIPAAPRRTRDRIAVLGSSAGRQQRRVAPSTSWVAFSARAKVSSAAGMSSSLSWW
jgi:hypothetical protein